jgi:hypothetical protein
MEIVFPEGSRRFGLADARKMLSALLAWVSSGSGNVVVIEPRGKPAVALVDVREQEALLAKAFPFSPEVYFHDDSVAIWLPELAVFGEGADLQEAKDDLVDAVLDYADSWYEDNLKSAPLHAARAGWLQRIRLAGSDEIAKVLFNDDEAADVRRASPVLRG